MSYYRHHLFFCTNLRTDGRACCAHHDAQRLCVYAKLRLKALGLAHAGEVRVNSAGCLDRCALGPTLVVYPEGIWYTYVDEHDLDEIIEQHLIAGKPVERLRI
jgi:(2Fe-2S) ferredoxin